MKVSIIGASGYTGGELIRLLINHSKVELSHLTSKQYKGEYVYRVHPNLRGLTNLQFIDHDLEKVIKDSDLVFTAVPHGTSVKVIPTIAERGIRIIDLSADFRLKDPKDYELWYGFEHPNPELLEKFVYGVPEIYREKIRNARFVANPGCMAIGSILALAPLVKEDLIEDKVIIDAKIASSGAGGKPSLFTHYSERYNVVRPYKVVNHRHTAEIEQELNIMGKRKFKVAMSPHAVNMVRGILVTCHTFALNEVEPLKLWRVYREMYGREPFIRLVKDKKGLYKYPDPKMVIGSNFCDIGFDYDERNNRIVSLAALDNLMKGASGNAVQCMNIMMGFNELEGLNLPALHPV